MRPVDRALNMCRLMARWGQVVFDKRSGQALRNRAAMGSAIRAKNSRSLPILMPA
jgi:hypothetical protein